MVADLPRHLVAPVSVVIAVLAQVTLVARLPLPGGPVDIVVVLAAAFGFARGAQSGLLVGLGAGALSDLLPPSDHALGRLALAYAAAGWIAGWLDRPERLSPWFRLSVVAVSCAAAVTVYAVLGVLTSDARVGGGDFVEALVWVSVYGVVFATAIVPLVCALVRRFDRTPALVG